MNVEKVGNRGFLFSFLDMDNYPTNVYLINGKNRFFVCDTFLGPSHMMAISEFALTELGNKPFVVFNSHYHWDHIWGNCYFHNALIVSHILTRERILRLGKKEVTKNHRFWEKEAFIKPPDCTFQEKILFPEDSVECFYSQGHTKDSSSCLDVEDGVLFVGDNLENPIPYLETAHLEEYEATLRQYKLVPWQFIVPGHGVVAGKKLLDKNIHYIQDLLDKQPEKYSKEPYSAIHAVNVKVTGSSFL